LAPTACTMFGVKLPSAPHDGENVAASSLTTLPTPGQLPSPASGSPAFPFPLPDWLAGNPYFTAGFGLAGIGVVTGLLRSSAASLEVVLRRQALMSLEIPSKDTSYQWVMQWLVAKGVHGARHLGVETTYAKDAAGRQTASFDFVPSPGRHWVRYRGSFIRIDRERETKSVDLSTGRVWESLTLTTLAWRPTLFHELLMEAKQAAIEREEGKTVIYQSYGHEWRPFGDPKRVRPFTSVIFDGSVAEEIFSDVHEFLSSQAWYLDRGIPYRRGYLLHGPPGCGKSSYVSALAGRLGYNICVLNLGEPVMTDDRLQHLLATTPPQSIVLLEDVDFAVGQSTAADPSGPYAGITRVSFSGLLNALDGVVATEERIVFMTTNHHSKLPRALVRPGRVDLSVYVGVATRMQLYKMFVRFFPEKEDMAEQFATICDGEGLSMAELQGFFMFFKSNPEGALANVGPYLEARRQAMEEQSSSEKSSPASKGTTSPAPHSEGPMKGEGGSSPTEE